MDCKIIKQTILDNPFDSSIEEHIVHCKECRTFYESAIELETQLNETYLGKIEFKSSEKMIMSKIKPKRNIKMLLVAVLLFLTITFTFAEELFVLAEEIPLVGDLLRYFTQDDGAESARENNYPIQDFIFEKEGYKLYVKDFYFDPNSGQFKIALEKDGEYIKGFSYGLSIDNSEMYWRDERNETTPWSDVRLGRTGEKDRNISIGVRINDEEIIFDELIISYDLVKQYTSKVIECNETIETKYGNLTIENIEIYPTAMYINTSYEFDDSVIMFHLMDLKIIDNLGREYVEDTVSEHLNPEGKQRFRMLGTCYNDETVNSLEVVLSSVKIKYIDELANLPEEELEGFQFETTDWSETNLYLIKDVQRTSEDVMFNLEVLESGEMIYPIHLAMYSNDEWIFMDKLDEVNESIPKSEQGDVIPLYLLSEWLDMDIDEIIKIDGKYKVIEQSSKFNEYYMYSARQTKYYTREEVEALLTEYNVDLSDIGLDYVFNVKSIETQWFNQIDLEVISGMSMEELEKSDEGKIKLIEHLKNYYIYYDLSSIDYLFEGVKEYGSLGKGGQVREVLKQVQYGGLSDEEMIRIGVMEVYQHTLDKTFSFDLK